MQKNEQERVLEQDARQGSRGKPVLYVLGASLILLAIAITGLMTWQGANSPPDNASRSQAASREQVTGSVTGSTNKASSANGGSVPAENPAYPNATQPSAKPN